MSQEEHIKDSLTLSVEELPLPSSAQGILEVLRKVLSKPFIQSIVLRTGQPIEVSWYKDMSDSLTLGEPDESPDSVLARVSLEEVYSTKPPREAYIDGLLKMTMKNSNPTHVFVGSLDFFKEWAGVPEVVSLPVFEGTDFYNFAGLRLLEVESLEEDVVVLLGGPTKDNELKELSLSYKLTT